MCKYVYTCACYHICMCTYIRTCRITYMYIFVTIFATILLQTQLDRIKWSDTTTDNKCAVGVASDTVTPKKTKSIDMQFHWIRDRVRQKQFNVTWRQGAHNLADFFTEAPPVHLHRTLMPFLVSIPPTPHTKYQTSHARRSHAWNNLLNHHARNRDCKLLSG